MEKWRKTCVLD